MKDVSKSSSYSERTNHITILQIQGNDAIKQQIVVFYLSHTKVERASFPPSSWEIIHIFRDFSSLNCQECTCLVALIAARTARGYEKCHNELNCAAITPCWAHCTLHTSCFLDQGYFKMCSPAKEFQAERIRFPTGGSRNCILAIKVSRSRFQAFLFLAKQIQTTSKLFVVQFAIDFIGGLCRILRICLGVFILISK